MLDLSADIAGRYATRLLARHGFAVTRVRLEHPEAEPSMIFDGEAARPGSPFGRFLDTDKSITDIDLRTPDGSRLLRELMASNTTVVSTFRRDAARALGVDAADVKAINPTATLVTITPYGQAGEDAGRLATEKSLFAHAGAMLVSGAPAAAPLCPNLPVASMLGGIFGAIAIALRLLDPLGDGVHIDISLMDVLVANLERVLSYYTYLEAVPYRGAGSGRIEQSSGGGFLRAADGYFYVFSGYQWFDRVLEMVGRSDLAAATGAGDTNARRQSADAINTAVAQATAALSVAELTKRAQSLRMPSGPVATVPSLFEDPQLQHRGTLRRNPSGQVEIQEPFHIASGQVQRGSSTDLGHRHHPGDGLPRSPLHGLRVLDLTHAFAGPTSSRILSDAGADVIKIESVSRLDLLARGMIPFANDTSGEWWERSGYFADRNLGKRAITLDMTHADGHDLFVRLVRDADVVMANFTPRVLREWRLEPHQLIDLNPRLVVLMMTGFGMTGPKSEYPALAGTMEAASGFSSFIRTDDDQPPGALGFNFGDMVSGVYGAAAVLFALHRQRSTGESQIIDLACAEAPIAFLAGQILDYATTGRPPSTSSDPFHAGGHVLVKAGERPGRQSWVLAYLPGVTPDAAERVELGSLEPAPSRGWMRSPLLRRELLAELESQQVLAVPLSDAEDLWYANGLRDRDLFIFATRHGVPTMPHPRALPLLWDGKALGPRLRPVPLLGEHNWEVLGEGLDLPADHFALLEQRAVIGTRPLGKLPRTFQVPLALDHLEQLGLLRRRVGARADLLESFVKSGSLPHH